MELVTGYGRLQSIVYRADDARFAGRDVTAAVAMALADPAFLRENEADVFALLRAGLGLATAATVGSVFDEHAVAEHWQPWRIAIRAIADPDTALDEQARAIHARLVAA